MRVLTGALLVAIGYELWVAADNPLGALHYIGIDFGTYMESTRRFLAGGGFYLEAQFHPSAVDANLRSVLYPPIALVVFVPMSYLPPFLWWLVPIATIAYVAWRQSRTAWQRVALLAAIASPAALTALITGNGSLWVAAAVVAGNRWGWPAAFIVLKPTFAPWSLVGVRSRSWWIAMAALVALSLAMLPMWLDWVHVMLAWAATPLWGAGSSQGSPGVTYLTSAISVELALLWLGTLQRHPEPMPVSTPASDPVVQA